MSTPSLFLAPHSVEPAHPPIWLVPHWGACQRSHVLGRELIDTADADDKDDLGAGGDVKLALRAGGALGLDRVARGRTVLGSVGLSPLHVLLLGNLAGGLGLDGRGRALRRNFLRRAALLQHRLGDRSGCLGHHGEGVRGGVRWGGGGEGGA